MGIRVWLENNVSAIFVGLLTGLLTGALVSWVTYKAGLDSGYADGHKQGQLEGEKAEMNKLAKHAETSRERIDASALKSEVGLACGEKLASADRDCASQVSSQRAQGFDAGRSAGRQSCGLEQTYSVFQEKISAGAEAADKGSKTRLLDSARQVVQINETAEISFGNISREVFDGPAVTELAEALRKEDMGKVAQIMKDLAGTLKTRDVVVNTELRRLEDARLK